ncbi:MAG TPA: XrtA/PEP-CTERM system TPR-repeat protein PrsT [Rhodocyclaceae bacterium]|nr:XrtA/PEP-CTERM system TPR-repeat protein PrsT [Rhodocyclaceae bacterium]
MSISSRRFNRIGFTRMAAAIAVSAALAACGDSPEKLIEAARQHLDKHDPAAASIELKNALAKNPDLAEARFLLGRALLESGDPENAEVELKKAADLKYNADKIAVLMARSLAGRGQFKKITDEYATLEPADPHDRAELKSSLAVAYAAQGKLDQAGAAFAAATAAQPDYVPALLGQARLKVAAQDTAGAQSIVDSVLAKNPKDVDALMFRASLQALAGQKDAALATYRSVLEIRPATTAAHSALIVAYLQDGKLDAAQQQLEAMQKADPKGAQTIYMQGLVALQQKKLTVAKESVQTLLRAAPNDPRILQLAGAIEFENRSDLQAQEYLSQALARDPQSEFARRLLVKSYLRTGQVNKAVAALQPALDGNAPSSAMLTLAGEAYMQAGDSARAESYFNRVSKIDPGNASSRTALAMIQVSRGDSRGTGELEEIAASDKGSSADMALIATHLNQKRYDQALTAIAALEKKQPDNLAVYNLRAAALHGKGDVAGARKSLEQALSRDPSYFPAAAALARLDLMDKQPDQAAGRFESLLAKDPKNVQALLALAELRDRQGKSSQDVVDLLKRATSAAPTDVMPRAALIGYYLRLKDTKSAVTAAQEAIQALPDRPEILDAAGRAMQEAGDFNQATGLYTKLATQLPNTPQPYLRLAEVQLAAKNREAAREALSRGLVAQPNSVPLQRGVVILNIEEKRYAEALKGARAIQQQEPKQAVGYLLEGDTYATQRLWSEAQTAYRNGLAKVPDSSELALRAHTVISAGGQTAEAAKFADAWLKAHPKDLPFTVYLAGSAAKRKDYAQAANYYRRALDVQPGNAAILNDYAWVLGKMGDAKAIGYAEQANRIAPNQPALMDTLGMLQVEQGQVAKGTELLRKAVGLAPQESDIRLNLARALIKGGDKSGARTELENLSKLGDKYDKQGEVSELLKTL